MSYPRSFEVRSIRPHCQSHRLSQTQTPRLPVHRFAIGQHLDIDLASPGKFRSRTANEGEHAAIRESAGWTTASGKWVNYTYSERDAGLLLDRITNDNTFAAAARTIAAPHMYSHLRRRGVGRGRIAGLPLSSCCFNRFRSARSSEAVWHRTSQSFSSVFRMIGCSSTGRREPSGAWWRMASKTRAVVLPLNGSVPVAVS